MSCYHHPIIPSPSSSLALSSTTSISSSTWPSSWLHDIMTSSWPSSFSLTTSPRRPPWEIVFPQMLGNPCLRHRREKGPQGCKLGQDSLWGLSETRILEESLSCPHGPCVGQGVDQCTRLGLYPQSIKRAAHLPLAVGELQCSLEATQGTEKET